MRSLLLLVGFLVLLVSSPARAQSYVHVRVEGVINPIKARYVERALARAGRERAEFVLVSIDSPGGLVSSMEKITVAFTNSPIPIVGYVEPTSAQATSAAAIILLATDVAAMTPHTRVGAAHPVGAGQNLEGAMDDKATNSMVALAKSLAARRGRPESFAEAIVRQSASYTAEEAKRLGAIELVAQSREELLTQIHGRKIELRGQTVVLNAEGAKPIPVELAWTERLFDAIADPTIASMLLSLGILGILYELSSPGLGMAGIVGVISLLTGLAALSVLPLELGGVLLLAVGLIALAVEIKAQTHGMIAAGGVVSLIIGALLLVDRESYFGAAQLVNWRVFAPFIVVTALAFVLLARVALRSQKSRFHTGVESLIGKHGRSKTAFSPAEEGFAGSVFVDGARWAAVATEPLAEGEEVKVVAVLSEPARLKVVPTSKKGAA